MKIGIDPGIGGAIAFITDKNIEVIDMPIMKQHWSKKNINMVDTNELHRILASLYNARNKSGEKIGVVKIESINADPRWGSVQCWRLGGAFYSVLAVVNGLNHCFDVEMVLPTQWKKKYGLINTPKDMSRLVVLKMYPHLSEVLKRKKDVDRADAILIAGY